MTVIETIRSRRSVRNYDGRAIPADVLGQMMDALRLAPSACNNQPWKFVLVTDAGLKRSLAEAAHRQQFIADAPVVVVGVGFPEKAYPSMGGHANSIEIDLAIALDHLTLAAAEAGLGTCWIGAFAEEKVRALLNAPANARIVAMTPLGYPADSSAPTGNPKRKPAEEIFVQNRFGG